MSNRYIPQYSYIDGTWGTLSVNGTPICANKWDFTATAKNTDTPVSCKPGFNLRSPGQRSGSGSMTLFFDGKNLPTIQEGTYLQNLRLGNQGATPGTVVVQLSCATVMVDSVKITNPNPGSVTYDIDYSTSDTYQYGDLPAPAQGS